jgi:hypothetical protein
MSRSKHADCYVMDLGNPRESLRIKGTKLDL